MNSNHIKPSTNRRYLETSDGKPFFWLADTAWNGALKSTDDEWEYYLSRRAEQGYSVIQFVTTQWRSAPDGDIDGRLAYTGLDRIEINPDFFERIDSKIDAINRHGLVAAPVMLWTHPGRDYLDSNPGHALSEDQAILLAQHMVSRWSDKNVVWIINGDGDYTGELSDRWERIGRAVFGESDHAPIAIHSRGKVFHLEEFGSESWLDIVGYQSGHYNDDESLRWIFDGPVTRQWQRHQPKAILNLEPPYENHLARGSGKPFAPYEVRRAMWWSLLAAPMAGITYGGHGIWGWDDGTSEPVDHPGSGVPLAWKDGLEMPGGTQAGYIRRFFESIDWWKLRPAPWMVAEQPSTTEAHISASAAVDGSVAVVYSPISAPVSLSLDEVPVLASWFDPETGKYMEGEDLISRDRPTLEPPGDGDWALKLEVAT